METTRTNFPGQPEINRNPFLRQKGVRIDPTTASPRPTAGSTIVLLLALLGSAVAVVGGVKDPARVCAHTILLALAVGAWLDFRAGGMRNLVRADLFALLALYFLTLFEFLFPQREFYSMAHPESVRKAVMLVIWALGAMAVGRHCGNIHSKSFSEIFLRPVPASFMISLFWFATLIGYLHMLVAVNFNVIEMVRYFLEPRFSQPWARGRLGDWKALLVELGLFMYLIPPLAGVIFARRKNYPNMQLVLIGAALAFTMFYGFTTGTRNIFASFLLTFCIGYAFALEADRRKELITLALSAAALLVVSTILMLEFRTIGFTNYFKGESSYYETPERTLFVDYNLYAMSQLVEVFPTRHPYLGWEIPYQALIRPIPRAIWKGKPEGLSMSIEEAVGAEGWTVAASMVGEAYMAAGVFGVVLLSFLFGAVTGWWGHLASPRNSDFGNLVYASGFFAAAISMRSVFTFTTAILPTIGALVIGALLIKKVRASRGGHSFRRG